MEGKARRRWSVVRVALVVVVLCAVAVAAVVFVSCSPEPARQTHCRHNLKQLALALHNYCESYGTFPPAYLTDAEGRPAHSWRVLILPFLECKNLLAGYRFDEPWNSPHNLRLADPMPWVFRCPSYEARLRRTGLDRSPLRHMTNYVVVVDPQGVFPGSSAVGYSEIKDDPSQTLLLVEVSGHVVHWMEPNDVSLSQFLAELALADDSERSNHPGVVLVAMADGSVTALRSDVDLRQLRALLTRSGGEK